jgi:hypothetical protein
MGTGSFPGVKSGRGVTLTPHPLLVPWSWNSRAILLLPLWACTEPQCLYKGALYLFLPYLEQVMKAQKRSRGKTLLFLQHRGSMGGGGQRHAIAVLPPGMKAGTQCRGWSPGPVCMGAENLAPPTGIRSPDRPASSESLYRLNYTGPHRYFIWQILFPTSSRCAFWRSAEWALLIR